MLKKITLTVILIPMWVTGFSQKTKTTVAEYIETYQDLAVSEMERTGIPASITLAQGIIESANGNSRLATDGNNHFGIKCKKNWTGKTIYADDDELNECFRAYPTAKDSYIDHSVFLMDNARYSFLFDLEPDDYKGWARGLKTSGYATNPQYADILIGLIERHELNKLDKKERILKKEKEKEPTPTPKIDPLVTKEGELFKYNGIIATRVMEGQTAISIAQTYQLHPKQLYKYNDLKEGSDVVPGSVLYLKPKRRKAKEAYHTVQKNETMYSIAQLHGVKLKQLYKKNKMDINKEPAVGQVIYMRRKRRTAPELRTESAQVPIEVIAPVTETYSEKPAVTISPNKEEKTAPAAENLITEIPNAEVKIEKVTEKPNKPVFVEKKQESGNYNVAIEEKNKVQKIEKKQLDNVQYHTVLAGETLFAISRKYGKSVDQLKQLNALSDYSLAQGQKIIVNENFKEKQPDTDNTSFYHEVQKGETLFSVAKKYNIAVDELKKLNSLTTDVLSLGSRLLVSKASKQQTNTEKESSVTANYTYHIVAKGETLFAIAKKYNTQVDALKRLNNLESNDLKLGQTLRVK